MYLPTTTDPSVCHSLSPNKRKLFCLFVCHDTLFLLWCGYLLSLYPSWHAPSGSNSALLILGDMSSQQDTSPKRTQARTSNRSFPSPHRQTMRSYLWPMTSPCPILAGYKLVRFGPCACLSSMYVQNLPAAHALPWLACTVCRPFFTIFWFSFPLWLALPRDWALLDSGLCFSLAHPFSCYHLLPYHSIIFAAKLFALILLGLFEPIVCSSPNSLVRPLILLLHYWRAPMSHLFFLRCLKLVCFP